MTLHHSRLHQTLLPAFGTLSLKETQVLLQLPASQISRGSACRPAVDFASA